MASWTEGGAPYGRDGLACGIDLSGFSPWVENAIARDGRGALEAVADDVTAILTRAADAVAAEGFALGCLLGDGLIAIHRDPGAAPAPAALAGRVRAGLGAIAPWLRLAVAPGSVTIERIDGWNGSHHLLIGGNAVDACQRRLATQPRAAAPRRAPDPVRPSLARLGDADIADRVIACASLAGALAAVATSLRTTLPVWEAEADASGGRLERVAYDDGKVLLRFGWPDGAASRAAARGLLATIAAAAPAGTGIAHGAVFRGRVAGLTGLAGDELEVAHGTPINRAAKAAKAADSSPTTHAAPAAMRATLRSSRAEVRVTEHAACIAQLRADPAIPLLVEGEPGIGKTAFVDGVIAVLARDSTVLAATARPSGLLDPLRVWRDLVAQDARGDAETARTIALLDPALAAHLDPAGVAAADRAPIEAVFDAILALIAAAARRKPLLVAIDDLQWADPYSLRLLDAIARAVTPPRLLLAARAGFTGLPGGFALRRHHLSAMSAADLRAVAASHGAALPPATARLAGGNPLFAIQLALAELGAAAAPRTIASVIDLRLAGLGGNPLALLRVAAVADRALPLADLRTLGVLAGMMIDPAEIDRLVAQSFLRRDDRDSIAPGHRLIRDRIVHRMPGSVRLRLHALLAWHSTNSRRRGASPGFGVIGDHWREAGNIPRAALADLRDADAALAASAHAIAEQLFSRAHAALTAIGADPARRALAAAGRGLSAWGQGEVTDAQSFAVTAGAAIDDAVGGRWRWIALALPSRAARLSPRLRLAISRHAALRTELGYFAGRPAAILGGGLMVAAMADAPRTAALARSRGTGMLALGLGLAGLERVALRMFNRCVRAGEGGAASGYALCQRALFHCARGEWRDGVECLDRAEPMLGAPPDQHLLGAILCARALVDHFTGRSADSIGRFVALGDLGRSRSNRQVEAWALYGAAMPMLSLGDDAQALDRVLAAQRLLEGNDDRLSVHICHALRARLAREPAAALDHVEAALATGRAIFPGNFGSLDGFALPAEIAARIMRDERGDPHSRARAAALFPIAMRQFKRFARYCPIGTPRFRAMSRQARRR